MNKRASLDLSSGFVCGVGYRAAEAGHRGL